MQKLVMHLKEYDIEANMVCWRCANANLELAKHFYAPEEPRRPMCPICSPHKALAPYYPWDIPDPCMPINEEGCIFIDLGYDIRQKLPRNNGRQPTSVNLLWECVGLVGVNVQGSTYLQGWKGWQIIYKYAGKHIFPSSRSKMPEFINAMRVRITLENAVMKMAFYVNENDDWPKRTYTTKKVFEAYVPLDLLRNFFVIKHGLFQTVDKKKKKKKKKKGGDLYS